MAVDGPFDRAIRCRGIKKIKEKDPHGSVKKIRTFLNGNDQRVRKKFTYTFISQLPFPVFI